MISYCMLPTSALEPVLYFAKIAGAQALTQSARIGIDNLPFLLFCQFSISIYDIYAKERLPLSEFEKELLHWL